MKDLKIPFAITSGSLKYLRKYDLDFQKFKDANPDKMGEVTYSITENSVAYHQHKWYRGFLLPPIAKESFDGLEFKAHLELKRKFLFRSVNEWEEIPKKYRSKCFPVLRSVLDGSTGEFEENVICGYLPSTADLNYEEMKDFILNVEKFMAEYLQVGWKKADDFYRDQVFKK